MSKVVHLSDDAHTAAKNFCKHHGLKMSDWVAELISEAIKDERVDPKAKPRPVAMVAPAPAPAPMREPQPQAQPQAVVHAAPAPPTGPAKKKLQQYDERGNATNGGDDSVPPWAAPPFWSRAQSK